MGTPDRDFRLTGPGAGTVLVYPMLRWCGLNISVVGLYNPPPAMHTLTEYRAFQTAYDYFNAELFEDQLPAVLVTLQRKGRTRGYFSPNKFQSRTGKITTDELALNPDQFVGRTDEGILSTLVHEMAHVWQQALGKPGRGRYHNKQWATKMKEVGLYPSTTGEVGGKETGERVSHYIISDGPFQTVCKALLATGFQLGWQSRTANRKQKKKKQTRSKFTCPDCGQNAWAKPNALLNCGDCYEQEKETIPMLADSV